MVRKKKVEGLNRAFTDLQKSRVKVIYAGLSWACGLRFMERLELAWKIIRKEWKADDKDKKGIS
jgi:hypothetical protein